MTIHHVESNIDMLLTRNLPIDSGVREWSLWAKSNNTMRGQLRSIWIGSNLLLYLFGFCSFKSMMWLLFHSLLERLVAVGGKGSFKSGRSRWRWKKGFRQIDRDGGRSWKLDNFHGCHMCIIPKGIYISLVVNI